MLTLYLNDDEQMIFEALKLYNYSNVDKIAILENLKHEKETQYDSRYIINNLIEKISNSICYA